MLDDVPYNPDRELTKDQNDPQHFTWHGTFRKYSWWRSQDNRVFVIVHRWYDNAGNLIGLELLEKGNETVIERPYIEIFRLFKQGALEPASNMP